MAVEGDWDPRFSSVVENFASTLESGSGAALSVWQNGREIIGVWGGVADPLTGRDWQRDTPTVVFSCTKGVASIAIAMLVDRGLLDYEAPVARYWPAFGAHGKDRVTVAEALAHRAGVPGPAYALTTEQVVDGHSFADAIADALPLWEPGAANTYHTLSHGVLTEQLVRAVDGRTLGRFIAEEIVAPLGLRFWLGAPEHAQRLRARPVLGDVPLPADPPSALEQQIAGFGTLGGAFPPRLTGRDIGFDDSRVLATGLGGAGGLGTAGALAQIWADVASESSSLLSQRVREQLVRLRGDDAPLITTLAPPYQRWATGVALASELRPMTSPDAFGHDGAGGQVSFADPKYGLGFAYVTNLLIDTARGDHCVRALRAVLELS